MILLKIKLFGWIGFILGIFSCTAHAVQIDVLPSPSLDAIGIQSAPFKNWGVYPMSEMEKIVEALTKQYSSPAMNEMVAFVLSSSTDYTPQAEEDKGLWLALRIKGLFDLGHFQKVIQLIDTIPSSEERNVYLPFYFNALLMQDDLNSACLISEEQNSRNAFWQKAEVLCQAFEENKDKARFTYELWREKNPQDTFFASLISHQLYGTSFQQEKIKTMTPMDAFLARKMGVKGTLIENIPPFMQGVEPLKIKGGFKNAVNLKILMENWQQKKVSEDERKLRLVQLTTYLDVFHPDVRYMYKNRVFDERMTSLNVSPLSVFLLGKTKDTITGADVLIALKMLQENVANLELAFKILKLAEMDTLVEQWMLERIS